ncbi:hypothetical protein SYNPS1DRAFT_13564 [Syncephalis pseudoplumigaleata]|uniref:Rab-GAP TBC domain-containing protein n=1 Tax=Syncephalis pseudoplumigaleata TaxID=1712513 RepID=A0A4P9Z349_9FUNG|nr:hypothetical protein SYNPS1DRAFT_13564 [Syncephalis pseudoplumigaleata]|eukprot:RKP26866.1 hypothetical protein SYNPS1DRAFT_13564 [Syncephalis pseudoplumigaleata]
MQHRGCRHAHDAYNAVQGFHDVCAVFLNVLGDTMAKAAALAVARTHLRYPYAMSATLDPVMHQMQLLYPLIRSADPELARFLAESDTPVYFALSWMISWFSHNIPHPARAARLYDLFIVSNPLMPLYVAAQLVIAHRDELLAGECEFTVVHHRLSNPRMELLTDQLLEAAVQLYRRCPLKRIQQEARHYLDTA